MKTNSTLTIKHLENDKRMAKSPGHLEKNYKITNTLNHLKQNINQIEHTKTNLERN